MNAPRIDVIAIDAMDPLRFAVTVAERDETVRYEVTLREAELQRLGEGATAEAFVAAAFRFLLDREPKEAILARFDIAVIARYFPEFDLQIWRYLVSDAAG